MNVTGVPDISIGSVQSDQGELRFTWIGSIDNASTLDDGESIVEICFISKSLEEKTSTVELSNDVQGISLINSDYEEVPYIIESGEVTVSNASDCLTESFCRERIHMDYTTDLVLTPSILIDSYQRFLACYGIPNSKVKLVDLNERDAMLRDSIVVSCENLRHEMKISIVIEETADFFHREICNTILTLDIPNELEDCIRSEQSCTSPNICQDITIEIDKVQTFIPYSALLNLVDDSCHDNYDKYQSTFRSVSVEEVNETTYTIQEIKGIMVNCPQYQNVLPVEIRGFLDFNNGSSTIVEICTSRVTMIYEDDLCDDLPDKIGLFIANGVRAPLTLNGIGLTTETLVSYAINSDDLLDDINTIEIDDNVASINRITTLDFALAFQGLVNNNLTPIQAIAADVDLNGSLSARDLIEMKKVLLGKSQPEHIGKKFLVDANSSLNDFDQFDFSNNYLNYQFEKHSIDPYAGILLDVFTYGDLDGDSAKSRSTAKSNIYKRSMKIKNQVLVKNQPEKITIAVNNQEDILSVIANIKVRDAIISNVHHHYDDDLFEYHMTNTQNLNFLFINPNGQDEIQFELEIIPLKDGCLNEVLSIGDYNLPELVDINLNTSLVSIDWTSTEEEERALSVSPNPTSDLISIEVPSEYLGGKLELYDILGQQVMQQTIASENMTINLSDFAVNEIIIVRALKSGNNQSVRVYVE